MDKIKRLKQKSQEMKYEVRITGQVVESENGGLGGVYANTPDMQPTL